MSFIAKNPLMLPKISNKPDTPAKDTDGLYATENGWYRIDENGNTYKFVTDSNYVHTDNNFTDDYKHEIEANSLRIGETASIGITAIRIAQGANQAKSFSNYAKMVEWFNHNLYWEGVGDYIIDYQIGQNIMIGTVNVPDLWIAELPYYEGYVEYIYTTDEAFVNDLKQSFENNMFLRVGFVALGVLETQKVDLTEYPDREEMNAAIQTAIGTVLGGAS